MESTTFIIVIAAFLLVVFSVLVVGLILFLLRKSPANHELDNSLQTMSQQSTILAERLNQLAPLAASVGEVQIELRGLTERIGSLEQTQQQTAQGLSSINNSLIQSDTVTRTLVDSTAVIREELSRAKNDLTELQTHTKARHELEQRTADSIRRLEAIIAGVQTKGSAGENILELVFAKLPIDWQVRNFKVGDKTVEFGLRLPNNLVLPIDSKWAATGLLEQLAQSENPGEQQKLKSQIENIVLERAKEVKKYIDPNITVGFGVAAVPDAVYDLCGGIQVDIFRLNVVLISYSMFVPYLLLVFQTILQSSRTLDLQKLDAYLKSVQDNIHELENELEGRLPKVITMLTNSRKDMSIHLSKISSGLTGLQTQTDGALKDASPLPLALNGEPYMLESHNAEWER